MSGASPFGPIIGDAAAAFALISPTGQRSIGTIFPDVAIEEVHRDEAQITVHPVNTGTPVSDHMFFMPQTVELRWSWSNSAAQAEGYVQEVYQQMLALQQSRQPQDISTGKRQYTNMLSRSVLEKTDGESEFSLPLIVIAQQLITTSVTTTGSTVAPNTNGFSPIGNVADSPGSGGIGSDTVAAQQAAAASTGTSGSGGIGSDFVSSGGLAPNSQGFVSFPNGVTPTGTVQTQEVDGAGDPLGSGITVNPANKGH